ncbi:MAG: hydantoinase B/oxoprolinase family protein [Anaerolineales bacterium]
MAVDAISLAVFRNLFSSVAEEMGLTLQRASLSANIKERLDFSCAVFDAEARMVAQAAHIPVHLGSMPASVAAALQAVEALVPGDVIILNDPYHGGTHLPDITLVSPIFIEDELSFFVASRAHHADVGGMTAGSLPLSTELYQEGLIIPPVKLVEAGVPNRGVYALIAANSRTPDERRGDLHAQLAAQRVGENRLRAIITQHGLASVHAHASALQDYTQRMTESVIRALPDGVYHFEDALEGDGQTEFRIPIAVTITVKGAAMTVDFGDSAPQVAGNVNAVPAIVRSATWYGVRLLSEEDIPVNHGAFQAVHVITRPGTFLEPAFPAAVAVGNTETSQRIVDVVLGALALAQPERIPAASVGSMNNITFGGTQDDKPFVYYETIGGGHGASVSAPGISGRHSHMTNTLNTPVEALERDLPLRIWRYELRDGSGGVGAQHGGLGIVRAYECLAPMTMTLNTERRTIPPYGLAGGAPGMAGRNLLVRAGEETILPAKYSARLQAGDQIIIETPGGGGYGTA